MTILSDQKDIAENLKKTPGADLFLIDLSEGREVFLGTICFCEG